MFSKLITIATILISCLLGAETRPVIDAHLYNSFLINPNAIHQLSSLNTKPHKKFPALSAKYARRSIKKIQHQFFGKEAATETCSYDRIFNCDFRPLGVRPLEDKNIRKLTKAFQCPDLACPGRDFLVGLYPFVDLPSRSTANDVTRIYNNAIYNKVCPGISSMNIYLYGVCLHMCKTDAECNQLHPGWHCCPLRDLAQDQFILSCVPPFKFNHDNRDHNQL